MDDAHTELQVAERDLTGIINDILGEVAAEFAAELHRADVLTAAFSVSRIARMWGQRLPRVVRQLLGIVEESATRTAEAVNTPLPAGWDNLPGRYDDGDPLPAPVQQYVQVTEHLLNAVGDRLAEVSRQTLAEGVAAGETVNQLRDRMLAAFNSEGTQLGPTRSNRIARTEAGRAWNTAALGAARTLSTPGRPFVKQWVTERDSLVRHAHEEVNGQLRLLDEPFSVGGVLMDAPHDPTAPPDLTINCFPGETLVSVPSGIRRIFRRWYEGPLVEVHTEDGGKLAGTPNHPLLTDTGWKPLQGVEVGDQLVGTPIDVGVSVGDPDVQDGPTSLAELYCAAHEAGMPSRIVRGGVDFHGDVADGDVEVVSVDSNLWSYGDTSGNEGVDNLVLDLVSDAPSDLSCACHLRRAGHSDGTEGLLVTFAGPSAVQAACFVSGGGQVGALLEREALHSETVGFASGTDLHPGLDQASANRGTSEAKGLGQSEFGFSGDVTADDLCVIDQGTATTGCTDGLTRRTDLDSCFFEQGADAFRTALVDPRKVHDGLSGRVVLHKISGVERRWFSGRVYNLESGDGWYIANDIASHNCRCILAVSDSATAASSGPYRKGNTVTVPDPVTAAASGPHTGAMIALMPTARDAARLAIGGGEPPEELHLTLFYLGEGADWSEEQRQELIVNVRNYARNYLTGLIEGRAFGANHWNPGGDEPCWVWSVGDGRAAEFGGLQAARHVALAALDRMQDQPQLPDQHTPWQPHVAAIYSGDSSMLGELTDRVGPIVFDRIRLAFAGEHTDIPLVSERVAATRGNELVSDADVWNHGLHASNRNEGTSPAGDGRSNCGHGDTPAQRLSPDLPDAIEASRLGGHLGEREGAAGQRHPGGSGGEVQASDPAAGGRTPHVPHGAVRRTLAPEPDPVRHAQRAPRGGTGTGDMHSPSAPVRPEGRAGMGGVHRMPAGGDSTLGGTQSGQATRKEASPGGHGATPSAGQGAPEHTGVQGQGSCVSAGAAESDQARGGRVAAAAAPEPRGWSTPGDTALAFENEETGDGRVFTPGSLIWEDGPWPLQYAEEMLGGHAGAELCGSITGMTRDGGRITGGGVLYPNLSAGADAIMLLDQDAPLGVSVDLDDVDIEFVDRRPPQEATMYDEEPEVVASLTASLATASVLQLPDGSWVVRGTAPARWTASGNALLRSTKSIEWTTGSDGRIPAAAVRTVLAGAQITAAAGDPDDPTQGEVVHTESAGDMLMRITRGRVRGATLVAMPAYNRARIVLDPLPDQTAACPPPAEYSANEMFPKVIRYVTTSPTPVGAREVSKVLGIAMQEAAGHIKRALGAGRLVRLSRGLYVGASTIPEGITAAMSGNLELPIAAVLQGSMGGVDIPQDEQDQIKGRVETLYSRIGKKFGEPDLRAPWVDEAAADELEASARAAMEGAPPMPAAWFRQPTAEELPPGSGGVHYSEGRIFGWVAQAGEPHAGMPGKNLTIESLGRIDLSHFLRARFKLDDGGTVRAGAFTMNVGHHRDGAECETDACQFDNTRTVAGIVTVGMSRGGMWFSGAAAPYLSDWDRQVFAACQPSYHMKQGKGGRWQLRAVLSVPVPGHSSPLVAAFAERANLALAASAAIAAGDTTPAGLVPPVPVLYSTRGGFADEVAAILEDPDLLEALTAALQDSRARRTEVDALAAQIAPARRDIAASLASTVTVNVIKAAPGGKKVGA